jgi:hypothetical protein
MLLVSRGCRCVCGSHVPGGRVDNTKKSRDGVSRDGLKGWRAKRGAGLGLRLGAMGIVLLAGGCVEAKERRGHFDLGYAWQRG